MSSPVIHIGVGLVALLLYFDDRHRMWALLLLPFAVLPDLDHFHIAWFYDPRIYFHNVFMLVPPLVVGLYGLATKRTLVRDVGFMASFLLWTHLMLDFFTGGRGTVLPTDNERIRLLRQQNHFRRCRRAAPKDTVAVGKLRGIGHCADFPCLSWNSYLQEAGSAEHRCW